MARRKKKTDFQKLLMPLALGVVGGYGIDKVLDMLQMNVPAFSENPRLVPLAGLAAGLAGMFYSKSGDPLYYLSLGAAVMSGKDAAAGIEGAVNGYMVANGMRLYRGGPENEPVQGVRVLRNRVANN